MEKKLFYNVAAIVLLLIPLAYLAFNYAQMPTHVPLHFDMNGQPDRFGNKNELLFAIAILQATGLGIFLILNNIYKIDPKKTAKMSRSAMQKIALAVLVLISIVGISIVHAAGNVGFSFGRLLLPVTGLFFAFIGNVLYSVKQNYFLGIRTPWALEDAENWRKTHQLAGKTWFAGGLAIVLCTLLLPFKPALVSLFVIGTIITIIPVLYSYNYYRKHKAE